MLNTKKKNNIDQINNISTLSRKSAKDFDLKKNERVVGIIIDTESKKHQNTIYYYKTTEDFKVGDKINPVMNTGGHPDCVVVSVGDRNNTKYKSLKELEF